LLVKKYINNIIYKLLNMIDKKAKNI
jgi:hypothetical protein